MDNNTGGEIEDFDSMTVKKESNSDDDDDDDNDFDDASIDELIKQNENYLEHDYGMSKLRRVYDLESIKKEEEISNQILEEKFNQTHSNKILDISSLEKGFQNQNLEQNIKLTKSEMIYKALELNYMKIKQSEEYRSYLKERLHVVERNLKDIDNEMNSVRNNSDYISQHARKRTFKNQYFIDSDNFACPLNKDALKINDLDIMPLTPKLPKRWTKTNINNLYDVLVENVGTSKHMELNRLNKMSDKDPANRELNAQIIDLTRTLEFIDTLSDTEKLQYINPSTLDWKMIANKLYKKENQNSRVGTRRSANDCKVLWMLNIGYHINQKKFTKKEDKELIKLAKKYNYQNWDLIAKELNTSRSSFQCVMHYTSHLDKRTPRPWTAAEDDFLMQFVKEYYYNRKWLSLDHIAIHLDDRRFSEIQTRLAQLKIIETKRNIKKGPFSKNELQIIEKCYRQGLTNRTIAVLLGNRTPDQIRDKMSRDYRNPEKKTGFFTIKEDKFLMDLIEKYGTTNWTLIAKKMVNRDRTQCRHRYYNILKNIKEGKYFKINRKLDEKKIVEHHVKKIIYNRAVRKKKKKESFFGSDDSSSEDENSWEKKYVEMSSMLQLLKDRNKEKIKGNRFKINTDPTGNNVTKRRAKIVHDNSLDYNPNWSIAIDFKDEDLLDLLKQMYFVVNQYYIKKQYTLLLHVDMDTQYKFLVRWAEANLRLLSNPCKKYKIKNVDTFFDFDDSSKVNAENRMLTFCVNNTSSTSKSSNQNNENINSGRRKKSSNSRPSFCTKKTKNQPKKLSTVLKQKSSNSLASYIESLKKTTTNTQSDARTELETLNETTMSTQPDARTDLQTLNETTMSTQPDARTDLQTLNETTMSTQPDARKDLQTLNEMTMRTLPDARTDLDTINKSAKRTRRTARTYLKTSNETTMSTRPAVPTDLEIKPSLLYKALHNTPLPSTSAKANQYVTVSNNHLSNFSNPTLSNQTMPSQKMKAPGTVTIVINPLLKGVKGTGAITKVIPSVNPSESLRKVYSNRKKSMTQITSESMNHQTNLLDISMNLSNSPSTIGYINRYRCSSNVIPTSADINQYSSTTNVPSTIGDINQYSCINDAPSTSLDISQYSCITNVPSSSVDINQYSCITNVPSTSVDINQYGCITNVPSSSVDVNQYSYSNTPSTSGDISQYTYTTNAPSTSVDVNQYGCSTNVPSTSVGINQYTYTTNAPSTSVDVNQYGCSTNVPSTSLGINQYTYTTNAPSTSVDVNQYSCSTNVPSTSVGINQSTYTTNAPSTSGEIYIRTSEGYSVALPYFLHDTPIDFSDSEEVREEVFDIEHITEPHRALYYYFKYLENRETIRLNFETAFKIILENLDLQSED